MILFSIYTPDLTALRTESFVVSSWLTDDSRFKTYKQSQVALKNFFGVQANNHHHQPANKIVTA